MYFREKTTRKAEPNHLQIGKANIIEELKNKLAKNHSPNAPQNFNIKSVQIKSENKSNEEIKMENHQSDYQQSSSKDNIKINERSNVLRS